MSPSRSSPIPSSRSFCSSLSKFTVFSVQLYAPLALTFGNICHNATFSNAAVCSRFASARFKPRLAAKAR